MSSKKSLPSRTFPVSGSPSARFFAEAGRAQVYVSDASAWDGHSMERQIKLENRAALDDVALTELIRQLSGQSSIRHVVNWLGRHQPPLKIEDMVTQDEFSHDIMVPYRQGLYLVYDST
jgi:hypothetical protein